LEPGSLSWIFTGALAIWSAWLLSAPGMEDSLFLLGLAWFLTGLAWALRGLAALALLAWRRRKARIRWIRFGVQPLLVALVFLLASTNAPLEARFAAGRSGLETDAKAVLAGTETPQSIHRSGGYALAMVRRSGSTVLFHTQFGEGFAYAPHGVPTSRYTEDYLPRFHHFHGPWYRFDTPGVD
jgi:hypothetical protein